MTTLDRILDWDSRTDSAKHSISRRLFLGGSLVTSAGLIVARKTIVEAPRPRVTTISTGWIKWDSAGYVAPVYVYAHSGQRPAWFRRGGTIVLLLKPKG